MVDGGPDHPSRCLSTPSSVFEAGIGSRGFSGCDSVDFINFWAAYGGGITRLSCVLWHA